MKNKIMFIAVALIAPGGSLLLIYRAIRLSYNWMKG